MRRKFTFAQNCTANLWPTFCRDFSEGDEIFEFTGHDYGCARDDAVYGGFEVITCSLKDGEGPFFTVPVGLLLDKDGKHPSGEYGGPRLKKLP